MTLEIKRNQRGFRRCGCCHTTKPSSEFGKYSVYNRSRTDDYCIACRAEHPKRKSPAYDFRKPQPETDEKPPADGWQFADWQIGSDRHGSEIVRPYGNVSFKVGGSGMYLYAKHGEELGSGTQMVHPDGWRGVIQGARLFWERAR